LILWQNSIDIYIYRALSLINNKFNELRKEKRLALMPFLIAGDPSLELTSKILLTLQDQGADLIELGIPYSDPLADGPIIQLAASRALREGTSLLKVLNLLSNLKNKLRIPIVLFTYFNPLLNFGFNKFCKSAAEAGVSGLIIPDLPLEEVKEVSEIARQFNLDLILLVAPTTPFQRMKSISEKTRGFTYLVSVTGVTGERNNLENRVENLITKLKNISTNPIAVGFGISSPEHVQRVKKWGADGVIVGSAFVKRIYESDKNSVLNIVGDFCKKMRIAANE
tara:strand:- start:1342 stop:2184 length:843 start_codon:yes stop_codon:yes gene_type:complete